MPVRLQDDLNLTEPQHNDLITMNDDLKFTFSEIALELESLLSYGSWTSATQSLLDGLKGGIMELE
jgi:hypothetical protein